MTHSTNTFAQLGLSAPILRALTEKNYTQPSPIQAEAIPHLLAGRDLMGSAQTGTGKTAAFALPILQRLAASTAPRVPRSPRALILTPTRELAVQIASSFAAYGRHLSMRCVLIYGGVGQQPQVRGLHNGCDIVVATPGRLLDLAQQGHVRFDHVEIFVLDEADRMLDMGFAPDVKRILAKLPEKRQSLLFSATLPASILALAARILNHPVRVEMTPETPTVDRVAQGVCMIAQNEKYPFLRHIINEHPEGLVLVFARTKHGAKKIAANLGRDGYTADDIHGNKSQSARQRSLERFRTGAVRVLVATDVAARGIDVKGIALVVNYDLPHEAEAYVHRIGRTARAGAEGIALSFCDGNERSSLRNIQRLIRQTIPIYQPKTPYVRGELANSFTPDRPARAHRTDDSRSSHAPRASYGHRAVEQRSAPSHRTEEHRAPAHRNEEYRIAPAAHRNDEYRAAPATHRSDEHRTAPAHRSEEHRSASSHRSEEHRAPAHRSDDHRSAAPRRDDGPRFAPRSSQPAHAPNAPKSNYHRRVSRWNDR
jgi:ATP-dependent RNA helicase RhlE